MINHFEEVSTKIRGVFPGPKLDEIVTAETLVGNFRYGTGTHVL